MDQALASTATLAVTAARLAQARATLARPAPACTRRWAWVRAPAAAEDLGQPAAHQLRARRTSRRCRTTPCSPSAQYEIDLAGRVGSEVEGAAGPAAIGGRPREHPAAADRRPGRGLLQPARGRRRARRGDPLHRRCSGARSSCSTAP